MAHVNRISDVAANRPAANLAQGSRFLATDTGVVSVSTGAAWVTVNRCEQADADGITSGLLSARPTAGTMIGWLYKDENNIWYEAFPGGWATLAEDADLIAAEPVGVGALTPGATVSFAPGGALNTLTLTPGQDETINAVTTGCVAGRQYFLKVTTSGTTSRTLTFGTNFKSTGTLATGTTNGKVFVMAFLFDGTNFNEVSRTTAM